MSAEIESLPHDMNARRTGGGASPMLVALAVLALLLAIWAHWRFNHFDDRVDKVRRQVADVRAAQGQLAGQIVTLTTRLETSQAALRSEIRGLKELPAQLAVLGRGVEELKARAEAPQRAWARAEALYLLDLAQRQLDLDHDVVTAIAAMEAADARLAAFKDPAMAEVRRLLARDLAALRAVPLPNLAEVLERLTALERAAPGLPILGVPLAHVTRAEPEPQPAGTLQRAWRRVVHAFSGLASFRRVDPASMQLVTKEEQSLRQQHLELLLLTARVAAMQPDGPAYTSALEAAGAWLAQYFDTSSPEVRSAQQEILALRGVNVEPQQPQVGAAARQLQMVMHGGSSAP
jgi:uroporphyrin-3 C-methyltransferase